jgi:hypothetical protein
MRDLEDAFNIYRAYTARMKWVALRYRLFDSAALDEAVSGFAQDDRFSGRGTPP